MPTLDPSDWSELRALGHQMMDDMIDHLAGLRELPVWQKMPEPVRESFTKPLPRLRYGSNHAVPNLHRNHPALRHRQHPPPLHGAGSMAAATRSPCWRNLLAGAMNANCGGRDHSGIVVERQVIAWAAEDNGHAAKHRRLAAHRLLDGKFRRFALRPPAHPRFAGSAKRPSAKLSLPLTPPPARIGAFPAQWIWQASVPRLCA